RDWTGKRPYVFTKRGMVWEEHGGVGYSLRAESIRRECEAGLRRLEADPVAPHQIHCPLLTLAQTADGRTTEAALDKHRKPRSHRCHRRRAQCEAGRWHHRRRGFSAYAARNYRARSRRVRPAWSASAHLDQGSLILLIRCDETAPLA